MGANKIRHLSVTQRSYLLGNSRWYKTADSIDDPPLVNDGIYPDLLSGSEVLADQKLTHLTFNKM